MNINDKKTAVVVNTEEQASAGASKHEEEEEPMTPEIRVVVDQPEEGENALMKFNIDFTNDNLTNNNSSSYIEAVQITDKSERE